jgi:uncharacterized Zn-finger protein
VSWRIEWKSEISNDPPSISRRNNSEDKKMHRCEFCSREFTRALYLRRHMFVHSDEKPFECNWCGKKLRSEYNLKYHMQRHVGVKEYVCGE